MHNVLILGPMRRPSTQAGPELESRFCSLSWEEAAFPKESQPNTDITTLAYIILNPEERVADFFLL